MKYLLGLVFTFLCVLDANAQDSAAVANDVTILYRKEISGGITIHANGLGVLFRNGRHVTAKKKRIIEAEFVSMRHPKQYKIKNEYTSGDPKPFFFGKLNYVYIPRIGMGMQNELFGKAEKSGVEVRYNYFGGLDLAFTKPVYNDVLVSQGNNDFAYIVTKRYDPNDPGQQQVTDFYGPGNYFMGFNFMRFYPGLYGKFSISFEYATAHEKLSILEAGMVVDVFAQKIPIMAYNENSQYFFNFFISIMWGARKN